MSYSLFLTHALYCPQLSVSEFLDFKARFIEFVSYQLYYRFIKKKHLHVHCLQNIIFFQNTKVKKKILDFVTFEKFITPYV